jgi:hypothetical protein
MAEIGAELQERRQQSGEENRDRLISVLKLKGISMNQIINGTAIPNLPWEERPQGCNEIVLRYSQNPCWIGIRFREQPGFSIAPSCRTRANLPAFIRADQKNGRATLFFRAQPGWFAVGDRPRSD